MQDTLDHTCICGDNIEEHDLVDDISICYKCNCTFWQPLDFGLDSDL
jgi:hypothetical protein